MNDQLLCGSLLAVAGIATVAAGSAWLAVVALAAAIPFLAVSAARLGGSRRVAESR